MPISPINFFAPPTQPKPAGEPQALANPTALSSLTGLSKAALASFSATLGQVLSALGPLALDTTLTATGTGAGGQAAAPLAGFTNTFIDLLLLNSLGLGQFASQSVVQQLLLTQLLVSSTATADPLGLSALATDQLLTTLVRQGTDGSLFVQLNSVTTQPSPMLFSAGALAQAFQIGNGVGTPP